MVEDTATPITVTGTGARPAAFTFAIGNSPAHGRAHWCDGDLHAGANYTGPDSFTFRVTQGALTSRSRRCR